MFLVHAVVRTLLLATNLTYIDPKFQPILGSLPANSIPKEQTEVKPGAAIPDASTTTTTVAPAPSSASVAPSISTTTTLASVAAKAASGDLAEYADYIKEGEETLQEIKELMERDDGWKVARKARSGTTVKWLFHPKYNRRIFLTEAEMPAPPEVLFRVIWHEGGTMDEWNESLEKVEILKLIGDVAQISRQIAANEAGGIVSQRDFVVLNEKLEEEGPLGKVYYVGYVSIDYPEKPPEEDFVRAENGPSGFRFEPVEGKPDATRVLWILNTDLKLDHMPSAVLSAVLPASTINYMKYLKAHLESMKEKGLY